ncbi:uncharacterized protein FOMMEDRAFT_16510 [Fomitiporia mediterranea MF3/22]|uniref:uncharacterized protein n=1 Tax=Fomitiporia mediterranea (strain MF3/22) TaxID=694068 RepID=UPI0004409A7A|nr:uncharacterized protein FOMMEDRAFT_16510 [Fomitiporia mediterranea MF3/22]EJD07972.1 hypothetical protein FOMMEDRAFT_16510 [Fomitiporia mediterranea MF3/22]
MAMALWGCASVQLYYYFNNFPKDELRLKILVTLVWALDTAHQGLISHSCYLYLVSNYGNPLFLFKIVPTLEVMVLLSAIVCLLVQSFLLYRVFRLSEKNVVLVVALSLLAIAQFIATTLFFAKGYRLSSFAEVPSIAWLSKTANSLAAATDVSIAITLIFLLHRSRTGFRRSETMINRLIIFTINTGAVTSVCALFAVLFVSIYPNALIYVAFYVCISRMYSNTLLATLNARKGTRAGFDETYNQGSSMILTSQPSDHQQRITNNSFTGRSLAIRVETETSHEPDNIDLDDLERDGTKVIEDSEHSYTYEQKAKLSHV